jgi:hypothetical protein
MIGRRIESHPRFPLLAATCLAGAATLAGAGAAKSNVHLALLSVPFWLAAAASARARGRPFAARFTETTVEVEEPPLSVPYAEIEGVLADGRPVDPYRKESRRCSVQILHPGGVLEIPARVDAPWAEVYAFLLRQINPRSDGPVHESLSGHLRHKQHRFGPDKVWSYARRVGPRVAAAGRRGRAVAAVGLLTGAAWIGAGAALPREREAWLGFGFLFATVWGMLWLVFFLQGRRGSGGKLQRGASLVISPDGLALVQGDLRGEMRWDELRDVKLQSGPRNFQWGPDSSGTGPGILLKVSGATIRVADIYDRPLALIYQQICYYWRADDLPATPPLPTGLPPPGPPAPSPGHYSADG